MGVVNSQTIALWASEKQFPLLRFNSHHSRSWLGVVAFRACHLPTPLKSPQDVSALPWSLRLASHGKLRLSPPKKAPPQAARPDEVLRLRRARRLGLSLAK